MSSAGTLAASLVGCLAVAQEAPLSPSTPAATAPQQATTSPNGATQPPPSATSSRGVPPLAIHSPAPSTAAIHEALDRSIAWLLAAQKANGSFGGPGNTLCSDVWANVEAHRSWTVATTGLAVMALLRHGGETEAARAAVSKAVDYLIAEHDLRRCDDWDIDNVWGLLYGLEGLANALPHAWFRDDPRRAAMKSAAATLVQKIGAYQSPNGGWGYYADQIDAWRPQWATSFTTAAMVVAMADARAATIDVSDPVFDAAVRALTRCRLQNGAFTYDVMALPRPDGPEGINDPRGSLCRIPACEYALALGGRPANAATLAQGYDLFFHHHAYLDCARMRPTPHEALHFNSGYFYFFGHYYAGELLGRLPAADRRDAAGKLAFEIVKTQERDGSCWDYSFSDYTRAYATAFAAMALGRVIEVLEPTKG